MGAINGAVKMSDNKLAIVISYLTILAIMSSATIVVMKPELTEYIKQWKEK